jgi:hypothetical protein
MSNGPLVRKDFEIVASFKRLVAKEMNFIIIFCLDKVQTIRLVPARRKTIKTNLTSNAVLEIQIGKLFLHGCNHVFANVVLQIIDFIVVAFLATAVSANGGNVEHAAAK